MTVLEVKAAVRDRDGHKCVKCGMAQAAHVAKYGKSLEVHRLIPGSVYSVDGCSTRCKVCHGYEPRGQRRLKKFRPRIILPVDIESELLAKARRLAARLAIPLSAYIRMATSERVEKDEATAPKKRRD